MWVILQSDLDLLIGLKQAILNNTISPQANGEQYNARIDELFAQISSNYQRYQELSNELRSIVDQRFQEGKEMYVAGEFMGDEGNSEQGCPDRHVVGKRVTTLMPYITLDMLKTTLNWPANFATGKYYYPLATVKLGDQYWNIYPTSTGYYDPTPFNFNWGWNGGPIVNQTDLNYQELRHMLSQQGFQDLPQKLKKIPAYKMLRHLTGHKNKHNGFIARVPSPGVCEYIGFFEQDPVWGGLGNTPTSSAFFTLAFEPTNAEAMNNPLQSKKIYLHSKLRLHKTSWSDTFDTPAEEFKQRFATVRKNEWLDHGGGITVDNQYPKPSTIKNTNRAPVVNPETGANEYAPLLNSDEMDHFLSDDMTARKGIVEGAADYGQQNPGEMNQNPNIDEGPGKEKITGDE